MKSSIVKTISSYPIFVRLGLIVYSSMYPFFLIVVSFDLLMVVKVQSI